MRRWNEGAATKVEFDYKYKVGDTVCWRTLNGLSHGVIESLYEGRYEVRMVNGTYALVAEESIVE